MPRKYYICRVQGVDLRWNGLAKAKRFSLVFNAKAKQTAAARHTQYTHTTYQNNNKRQIIEINAHVLDMARIKILFVRFSWCGEGVKRVCVNSVLSQ